MEKKTYGLFSQPSIFVMVQEALQYFIVQSHRYNQLSYLLIRSATVETESLFLKKEQTSWSSASRLSLPGPSPTHSQGAASLCAGLQLRLIPCTVVCFL